MKFFVQFKKLYLKKQQMKQMEFLYIFIYTFN